MSKNLENFATVPPGSIGLDLVQNLDLACGSLRTEVSLQTTGYRRTWFSMIFKHDIFCYLVGQYSERTMPWAFVTMPTPLLARLMTRTAARISDAPLSTQVLRFISSQC